MRSYWAGERYARECRQVAYGPGNRETHQLTGADGRHVCSTSLCEGQAKGPCLPQDGQHISPILRDQDGRHTVHQIDRGGMTDVGLVPPLTDNPLSITLPRFRQPGGRSRIQAGANISRMEASQEDHQQDMCSFGAMHSGPVCHKVEPPTGQM